MREGVNVHGAAHVLVGFGAGKGIGAVDVHGAGAADALAAGAAERQGGVELVFDLDKAIEHRRSALGEIDPVAVNARVLSVLGVPTIHPELLPLALALGPVPGLAGLDPGVPGERKLHHWSHSLNGASRRNRYLGSTRFVSQVDARLASWFSAARRSAIYVSAQPGRW